MHRDAIRTHRCFARRKRAEAVAQAALQRYWMADFVLVYLPMTIYRQCGGIFLRIDSILSAVKVAFSPSILVSWCGVLIGEFLGNRRRVAAKNPNAPSR